MIAVWIFEPVLLLLINSPLAFTLGSSRPQQTLSICPEFFPWHYHCMLVSMCALHRAPSIHVRAPFPTELLTARVLHVMCVFPDALKLMTQLHMFSLTSSSKVLGHTISLQIPKQGSCKSLTGSPPTQLSVGNMDCFRRKP